MTRTGFKIVPFDIELAKKITNKDSKGMIVTRDGRQVRIVCFDRKEKEWPIVALVQITEKYDSVIICKSNGACSKKNYDLLIEVPIYYRDYSNFVPSKWQPCLVRFGEGNLWWMRVCAGRDSDGNLLFYNDNYVACAWDQCLPLTQETEGLIGTTDNYEQLIQELDAESTATAKNEQQ